MVCLLVLWFSCGFGGLAVFVFCCFVVLLGFVFVISFVPSVVLVLLGFAWFLRFVGVG